MWSFRKALPHKIIITEKSFFSSCILYPLLHTLFKMGQKSQVRQCTKQVSTFTAHKITRVHIREYTCKHTRRLAHILFCTAHRLTRGYTHNFLATHTLHGNTHSQILRTKSKIGTSWKARDPHPNPLPSAVRFTKLLLPL